MSWWLAFTFPLADPPHGALHVLRVRTHGSSRAPPERGLQIIIRDFWLCLELGLVRGAPPLAGAPGGSSLGLFVIGAALPRLRQVQDPPRTHFAQNIGPEQWARPKNEVREWRH